MHECVHVLYSIDSLSELCACTSVYMCCAVIDSLSELCACMSVYMCCAVIDSLSELCAP